MTDSITNLTDAVAALGALPMPVGPAVPDALTQVFAPVAAHHDYRLGRELPGLGGVL
jgi:hypothetical protein